MQVLVYAGGIMVLFLFVVMLINVRHLPDEARPVEVLEGRLLVGVALLAFFIVVVRRHLSRRCVEQPRPCARSDGRRTRRLPGRRHVVRTKWCAARRLETREAVGMALYTDYLVPFEVASLFLLVAMIGAIVIGKRELRVDGRGPSPDYILRRIETENGECKEAMSA